MNKELFDLMNYEKATFKIKSTLKTFLLYADYRKKRIVIGKNSVEAFILFYNFNNHKSNEYDYDQEFVDYILELFRKRLGE